MSSADGRPSVPSTGAASETGSVRGAGLNQRVVVAVLYVSVMFMTILDSTVVNVAIPTLRTELGVGGGAVEWVVTAYLLGLAITVPIAGWLADRLGMVRLFVGGVVAFALTSAACAAANTLLLLIVARTLQGLAGGLLVPLGLAMLFSVFPPAERARASKILVVPTAIAPAVGPLLGGWLVDSYSWHWIFIINVPIAAVIAVFGALALREPDSPRQRGPLDIWGCALVGVGTAGVLYALGAGARSGWTHPSVLLTALGGIGALVVFALTQRRSEHPVLDLGLLRERLFRDTTTTMFFSSAAFIGMLFILPQYLQGVMGTSALQSGLTTFPEALGVITFSQIVGRLYPTIGPRRLMATGLVLMSGVAISLVFVDADTSLWVLRAQTFLLGGGYGCVLVPLQAASFARITAPQMARASSLFNTARQLASAVGVAALAAVFSAFGQELSLRGFRAAFVAAAIVAALGVVMAVRIHDSDAADTMLAR